MSLAGLDRYTKYNPSLAEALEETQDFVRQLNREIRTTSYLLHPPLLDENGLPQALQWYTHGLQERSSLQIELIVSEGFGRLPGDLELTIFRIIQESLTNIHRHSGSKTAAIRLARDGDQAKVEIQDYGKGFSREDPPTSVARGRTGVGIMGMRERVRHLNGQMDVRSNAGGTTILAVFPLSPVPDATVSVAGPQTESVTSSTVGNADPHCR